MTKPKLQPGGRECACGRLFTPITPSQQYCDDILSDCRGRREELARYRDCVPQVRRHVEQVAALLKAAGFNVAPGIVVPSGMVIVVTRKL